MAHRPWIDARLKLHPDARAGGREFLRSLIDHLDDYGVGSIAEVLRCWVKTA